MRALTTEEAAPRRRVIYVGRAAERSTTGPDLLDSGRILIEHHPGIIDHVSDDGQVYVRFVGLEDEPLSDSTWVPGASGRYPAWSWWIRRNGRQPSSPVRGPRRSLRDGFSRELAPSAGPRCPHVITADGPDEKRVWSICDWWS